MSPLARSLYALAALVAAAAEIEITHIKMPFGSRCAEMKMQQYNDTIFGTTTVITEFKSGENPLQEVYFIEDNCAPLNRSLASQLVKACNGYYKPSAPYWFAPKLHEIAPMFSPIYASCEINPECRPIVFEVVQKCTEMILDHQREHTDAGTAEVL